MLIFESRSERIVYLVWTPDGQHLSFLLGEPRGLSLVLAEVKESTPVRIVTTGMPLYFDWSPQPGEVALHTLALDPDRTEQVSLMSADADQPERSQGAVERTHAVQDSRMVARRQASRLRRELPRRIEHRGRRRRRESSAISREFAGGREQFRVGARLGAPGVCDRDHAAGSDL